MAAGNDETPAKGKPVPKKKPVVKKKEPTAAEKAAAAAKIEAQQAAERADLEEQDKQIAKMQALMQKFDDADAEREKELNKDYFRRYEQKSDQPGLADTSTSDASEKAQESRAKAGIMKDILSNFQFVQTNGMK